MRKTAADVESRLYLAVQTGRYKQKTKWMLGPIRVEDRKGSLRHLRPKWDQLRKPQLKPTRKTKAIRSHKTPSIQSTITFYSINWSSMRPGDWSWTERVIIALGSWTLLVVSPRGQYWALNCLFSISNLDKEIRVGQIGQFHGWYKYFRFSLKH